MAEQRTVFVHDDHGMCVYLGPFGDEGGITHDLRWCPQGEGPPTILGRTGDEPDEYTSGYVFADAGTPWAVEAAHRAQRRGLVHPCWEQAVDQYARWTRRVAA